MIKIAGNVNTLCVWEVDNIYLPWQITASRQALQIGPCSHPSRDWV